MWDVVRPHDCFFKELLDRPTAIAELLRLFLKPEILRLLDLTHPELVDVDWVDAELREHFADRLYRVGVLNLPSADGVQPAASCEMFLCLLFEHKSHTEEFVALQVLRYMVQHWTRWHTEHNHQPLPVIIPLVLYHGTARWRTPLEFESLFGQIPQPLEHFVPKFAYVLLDLSQVDDREIQGTTEVHAGLRLMKWILRPGLEERLTEILKLLDPDRPTAVEYLKTILQYVSTVKEWSTAEFRTVIENAYPHRSGSIMPTLAQQWIEQGREEGRVEGREEERMEARQRLLRLANTLISKKFGGQCLSAAQNNRLQTLTMDQLTDLNASLFEFQQVTELVNWLQNQ